jgi:hypothetical protein
VARGQLRQRAAALNRRATGAARLGRASEARRRRSGGERAALRAAGASAAGAGRARPERAREERGAGAGGAGLERCAGVRTAQAQARDQAWAACGARGWSGARASSACAAEQSGCWNVEARGAGRARAGACAGTPGQRRRCPGSFPRDLLCRRAVAAHARRGPRNARGSGVRGWS